ncbi:MAG: hypothetical protein ALAOOOJD_04024 [bacterium]|nr:hypothetical protein [bacterium]
MKVNFKGYSLQILQRKVNSRRLSLQKIILLERRRMLILNFIYAKPTV